MNPKTQRRIEGLEKEIASIEDRIIGETFPGSIYEMIFRSQIFEIRSQIVSELLGEIQISAKKIQIESENIENGMNISEYPRFVVKAQKTNDEAQVIFSSVEKIRANLDRLLKKGNK